MIDTANHGERPAAASGTAADPGCDNGAKMTGPEFRIVREAIGWSRVHMATLLRCHERTVRDMERLPVVRDDVARWIRPIRAVIDASEPPICGRAERRAPSGSPGAATSTIVNWTL